MKEIILVSGGYDSSYILWLLKGYKTENIYFDYGQVYMEQELKSLDRLKVKYKVIGINPLKTDKKGYVFGRNLTFLIEIAKRYKEASIIMGTNKDDIFPDNNLKYLQKALEVVNISFQTNLKLSLPLSKVSKKDIVQFAKTHNIQPYSCYKGKDKPCGKCKACLSIK